MFYENAPFDAAIFLQLQFECLSFVFSSVCDCACAIQTEKNFCVY